MSLWMPVTIPYVAERFIAFTIPDNWQFFVVSSEGVHEVRLLPEAAVTSDYSHPEGDGVFDGKRILCNGKYEETLGLYGGTAIVVDSVCNVLDLKPPDPPASTDDGVVEVWGPDGELVQSLPFKDLSGDWQHATFSTDYRHILIVTPYTITLYRRG